MCEHVWGDLYNNRDLQFILYFHGTLGRNNIPVGHPGLPAGIMLFGDTKQGLEFGTEFSDFLRGPL